MVPIFLLFYVCIYPEPLLWSVCSCLWENMETSMFAPVIQCADTSVWSDMLTISIKLSPNGAKQKSDLCQHFCWIWNKYCFFPLISCGVAEPCHLQSLLEVQKPSLRAWPWAWTYFLYPLKRIKEIFPNGISSQILWYLLKPSKQTKKLRPTALYLFVNTRWCCLPTGSKPLSKSLHL